MAVGPLAVAFSIAGPAFYSFSPPKTHVSISFFLYLKQRKSVISSYPGCVSVLAARVCVFGSYRSAESLRESNASRPSRANSNFCFFSWKLFFLAETLLLTPLFQPCPRVQVRMIQSHVARPFASVWLFFYNPNKHGQHWLAFFNALITAAVRRESECVTVIASSAINSREQTRIVWWPNQRKMMATGESPGKLTWPYRFEIVIKCCHK